MSAEPIVHIHDLKKVYGKRRVLDGVTFDVGAGEIFGFLGANGAGKTTTLEILEGLRRPTSGTVRLFGLDVQDNLRAIRQRIGVSLQSTHYWGLLTVRETLQLFRSFYARALPLDELVAMFDLEANLARPMRQLSGGNYQRVVLALALVNDPELVLLDEPTTGLDPNARRLLWDVVRKLRSRGRAVILTTHYMDEAQALCDRIAIINHGRVVQLGTPTELVSSMPEAVAIRFGTAGPIDADGVRAAPWCRGLTLLEGGRYLLYCDDLNQGLGGLMDWAARSQARITHLETPGPNLDDVFVHNSSPAGVLRA